MKKILSILFILGLFLGTTEITYSQVLDSPRDGVYDEIHTPEKVPIPYTHVREADVIWSKRIWRIIDLRQKINQPFYYPVEPQKGWRNLMTIIMEAVREGTITAYDPNTDDQFLVPMSYQEIETKYSSIDTMPVYDPDNPEIILEYKVITEGLDVAEIQRIKVKEVWFFDKQRSVMDVRILGICAVRNVYDEDGNFYALENLFWIYFPEARPVFAINEVFNRHNGAERRTYDEIFWKRMFGSYIYKEENVYNRDIGDYATGMDALLEAERVKNELFEFEHDLWEF